MTYVPDYDITNLLPRAGCQPGQYLFSVGRVGCLWQENRRQP